MFPAKRPNSQAGVNEAAETQWAQCDLPSFPLKDSVLLTQGPPVSIKSKQLCCCLAQDDALQREEAVLLELLHQFLCKLVYSLPISLYVV